MVAILFRPLSRFPVASQDPEREREGRGEKRWGETQSFLPAPHVFCSFSGTRRMLGPLPPTPMPCSILGRKKYEIARESYFILFSLTAVSLR